MEPLSFTMKDLVSKDKKVTFCYYQDCELWYSVPIENDEGYFEFPVPISDIGNARFLAEDKSILFMRWIRKHYDMIQKARVDHG